MSYWHLAGDGDGCLFQFQKVRLWATPWPWHIIARHMFQFQKVRLWVQRVLPEADMFVMFQFQKVRLWEPNLSGKTNYLTSFNSKRCDYEITFAFCHFDVRCFNSKRCDYEIFLWVLISLFNMFQFQKVRLWVTTSNPPNTSKISFNSKRCDYEPPEIQLSVLSCVFQFQKVRLWALPSAVSTSVSLFQFQKVRLWVQGKRNTPEYRASFNSKRCDYELTQHQII